MMRIQKYLSEQGVLSRREAEAYITQGRIVLNGKVVREMGVQIDPEKDTVEVIELKQSDGSFARTPKGVLGQKMTVAVYKPRGIVSSKNRAEGKTVFQVFPLYKQLNTVGRLDKESEGLLLLSNDGVITNVITGATHRVEKEYEVTVREPIRQWHISKMEAGIMLDGKKTLPARGELIDNHTFRLILTEGRTHQIRRMADALRLTIEKLIRIRIGDITLDGLTPGTFRALNNEEVLALKKSGARTR